MKPARIEHEICMGPAQPFLIFFIIFHAVFSISFSDSEHTPNSIAIQAAFYNGKKIIFLKKMLTFYKEANIMISTYEHLFICSIE